MIFFLEFVSDFSWWVISLFIVCKNIIMGNLVIEMVIDVLILGWGVVCNG